MMLCLLLALVPWRVWLRVRKDVARRLVEMVFQPGKRPSGYEGSITTGVSSEGSF